jgi:pimeloyl-ACP methyl ester carboxylesterase
MTNHLPTIVLVPGYWLGGWAWDDVAARLRADGYYVVAVTLPGVGGDEAARAAVTFDDQVAAVLETQPTDGSGVLVAHSGGGAVATGVLDRSPDRVRRVIYVDSGPFADGVAPRPDLGPDADAAGLPLPTFPEFEANGASLEGLDDQRRQTFVERAVPQPVLPLREPLRLTNPARDEVPTTIVCSSFSSDQVRSAASSDSGMFAPIAALTDVSYVDLPTGHWPMWSRPDDLARTIEEVLAPGGIS